MKLTKWMCLVAACIIAVPAFGKRKVPLRGSWEKKYKDNKLFIPIESSIEETTGELTLAFTEDLGDVVVTVTDASGKTVYQETVSTGNTPTWTVFLDESVQNGTVTVTDGVNLVYGNIIFYPLAELN